MAFKTPDAMIIGQATVDVIMSCCPNILDPWKLSNYDLDTVLLGIRIATYGETMDINATVPKVNEQISHTVTSMRLEHNARTYRLHLELNLH